MKNSLSLFLVIASFISLSANASETHNWKVIGFAKCTDHSPINNMGSIQVKILADTYEDPHFNEVGITLQVQSGDSIYSEKTPSLKNEKLQDGKTRKLKMAVGMGSGQYMTEIALVKNKSSNWPKAKLTQVTTNFEMSAEEEPANYNPTYDCR